MSSAADRAASDVYEIVTQETSGPKGWIRSTFTLVDSLLSMVSMGPSDQNPGGTIVSVRDKLTGEEVFRHVEDMGDDDHHLVDDVQRDLAGMTAKDFSARWVD